MLEGRFDLPSLMLTADEVEVAVPAAHCVAGRGDATLAPATQDLIAKISAIAPDVAPLN